MCFLISDSLSSIIGLLTVTDPFMNRISEVYSKAFVRVYLKIHNMFKVLAFMSHSWVFLASSNKRWKSCDQ